ncbi:hypothetical protein MMC19_006188 [Ptychographa xylographoides]|nr:hypothetical protein [Ptychographa xylographoides]
MLAIRNLARATPRSLARFSLPQTTRPLSALCKPSRILQTYRIASRPSCVAFSTTRIAWEKEGEVDQELSAKLDSELQLEKDNSEPDTLPPNIKDFLDNSPFELHDTAGQEEVSLTRTFGDEKIRVSFSIADLNALDQEQDEYGEDKALFDEDGLDEGQTGGAQSERIINQDGSKAGNFNAAPEDSNQPEGTDDELQVSDEDQEPSFPARLNITIEKPGSAGALQIESIAQDGVVVIENVYYFNKAGFAEAKSPQDEWDSRDLYTGPPYGNLDQDLQVLLERFLDERGINTALALWVPEYIDFKEQREYLNWLSEVKSFIDA